MQLFYHIESKVVDSAIGCANLNSSKQTTQKVNIMNIITNAEQAMQDVMTAQDLVGKVVWRSHEDYKYRGNYRVASYDVSKSGRVTLKLVHDITGQDLGSYYRWVGLDEVRPA